MSDCADNSRLVPDERLREAAAILAAGILRLRARTALPVVEDGQNPAKLPPVDLAISAETRLSVLAG